MIRGILIVSSIAGLAACSLETSASTEQAVSGPPHIVAESPEIAGEYLAMVGGCQDCHTTGWAQTGGQIPAEAQLLGDPVGFKGPWGTSYPGNLRLAASAYTPEEWVAMMKTRQGLPPMPWSTVNAMSDEDLLAIYAYLTKLGSAGEPVPGAVPPGVEPATPYIYFMPVGPESAADPTAGQPS